MFIRVKTTPNSPRKSIQICENIRTGDKVKQKIVHYVGIALDDREEQKLRDYGLELIKKITAGLAVSATQHSLFPVTEENISIKPRLGRPKQKELEDILPPSQVTLDDIVEEARLVEGVHEVGGAMFNEMYGDLLKSKRQMECLKDLVLLRLALGVCARGT